MSGDGVTWKPGVVVELCMFHPAVSDLDSSKWGSHGYIRIRVGEKVCVIRAIARCRMAMKDTTLPMEIVPGTNPPVFRWRQSVGTPFGTQVVDHEGTLPPNIEVAVQRLVGIAKQLVMENAGLRGRVDGLLEQAAKNNQQPPQQQVSVKGAKGKG